MNAETLERPPFDLAEIEPQVTSLSSERLVSGDSEITLVTESIDEQSKAYGVLIVGGFRSNEETQATLRHELTLESGHSISTLGYSEVPLKELHRTDEARVMDVVTAITAIASRQERIFIVAHSMGAAISLDALLELPPEVAAKVKGIMMVNGAGLIEGDGINEIVPRLIKTVRDQDQEGFDEGQSTKSNKKKWQRIKAKLREFADGINAARNMSHEELYKVKRMGIFVMNVVSKGDTLFPAEQVESSTVNSPIDYSVTLEGGDHFEPTNRHEVVSDLVMIMLSRVLGESALKLS
jgi:predicted alpha/beta hydrolase family esterase